MAAKSWPIGHATATAVRSSTEARGVRGIRYSLLSLLVIIGPPAMLMVVALLGVESERRLQEESVRQQLAQRAEVLASTQARVLRGSRNMLVALASHPAVATAPRPECDSLLQDIVGASAGYEAIAIIAPNGDLLCSSTGASPLLNYADRPYFQRAMASKAFTVGRYTMGRTAGKPLLPIAYPALDGEREVRFVVVAGHTLGWLDGLLQRPQLPANADIYVVDPEGGIVSRRRASDASSEAAPDPELLQALQTDATLRTLETDRHLFGIAPLSLLIPGIYTVVQIDKNVAFQHIADFRIRSIVIVIALTVASAFVLWLVSELLIRRPMRRLITAITRMEQGDLDARVGGSAPLGEMAQVGRAFDEMADRQQERERQLRQAQKMEAIGNLTGGLAHDFNNLLTVVTGNLTLAIEETGPRHPSTGMLQDALEAAWRGAELTRQLLAFARQQPLDARRIDVNEHLARLLRLLQRTLGDHVRIRAALAPDTWPVRVDPSQLETAILNLATNARDAMSNGGSLLIETANVAVSSDYAEMNPGIDPGQYVAVSVTDSGTGIPPEILDRVFEPFFTTKGPGSGTGLGLAMVFGFARQSGGQIKAYSEPGRGTTMRLYLPRDRSDDAMQPAEAAPVLPGSGEAVLVVDDNEQVRRVVLRQVLELGYRPIEARSAIEALEILEREKDVAVLVTDVLMPDMDGIALGRAAQAKQRGLAVLYVSGFPGLAFTGDRSLPEGAAMISKPFRKEELGQRIRQAIADGQQDRRR